MLCQNEHCGHKEFVNVVLGNMFTGYGRAVYVYFDECFGVGGGGVLRYVK